MIRYKWYINFLPIFDSNEFECSMQLNSWPNPVNTFAAHFLHAVCGDQTFLRFDDKEHYISVNAQFQDAAFMTEVHHVNGDGQNAGVVYCEMQSRENSCECLTQLALVRAMYPGGCGYKSETGGILENLRTSTSNEKVCINLNKSYILAELLWWKQWAIRYYPPYYFDVWCLWWL